MPKFFNPPKFYNWLQSVAHQLGYSFEVRALKEGTFPSYVEPEFIALLRKYRDKTMVPWGGLHTAYRAAAYIARNHIPGAVVECGVWRGGCALIMAEAIVKVADPVYDFYLYDTYAGMTEPGTEDRSQIGDAMTFYRRSQKSSDHTDWCYASIDEVWANIAGAGYPVEHFHLVKGMVEDTIPGTMPHQIALLRIDTDWYQSTRHELVHLFPRLVPGGVFICDDYGFWEGAQKAVDEFLSTWEEPFLLTVDSGTGRAVGIRR